MDEGSQPLTSKNPRPFGFVHGCRDNDRRVVVSMRFFTNLNYQ